MGDKTNRILGIRSGLPADRCDVHAFIGIDAARFSERTAVKTLASIHLQPK
jgi:hypothetical protein